MLRVYCIQTTNLKTNDIRVNLLKAPDIHSALKFIGFIPQDTDPNVPSQAKSDLKLDILYSEPVVEGKL